jgi:hypothetical protein
MLVCAFLCASCTRDRGCSAHPAFPAPSSREGQRSNLGQTMPRECETASLSTSLRGALATKQSIPPFARLDGLLRGACHPAALRADRVARNDPEGACHVLCVIARLVRNCALGEASTTRRPLGSSADASGILDRPVPSTPTAFVRRRTSAVKRLRRGSAVVARRSFSEGGEPGDDQGWLFDR